MIRIVYGICTGTSRMFAFVRVIFRIEPQDAQPREWKKPIFQRALWWARQGLNLRPHPCEGRWRSALASGFSTIFPASGNRLVPPLYEPAHLTHWCPFCPTAPNLRALNDNETSESARLHYTPTINGPALKSLDQMLRDGRLSMIEWFSR